MIRISIPTKELFGILFLLAGTCLQAQDDAGLKDLKENLRRLDAEMPAKDLQKMEKDCYSSLFSYLINARTKPGDSLPHVYISGDSKNTLHVYTLTSGQRHMNVFQRRINDSVYSVAGIRDGACYTGVWRLPDTTRELYLLTGHRFNETGQRVYCAITAGMEKGELVPMFPVFEKESSQIEYHTDRKESCANCFVYHENTGTLEIKDLSAGRSLYARYRPKNPLKINTSGQSRISYRFRGTRFVRE